jgi:hypothetical protein
MVRAFERERALRSGIVKGLSASGPGAEALVSQGFQDEGVTLTETGTSSGPAKKRLLTLLSSSGRFPVNPGTGKPFAQADLEGMTLKSLQLLCANTPATKLRGMARFVQAQELENAARGTWG